jgi:hypothetical protein
MGMVLVLWHHVVMAMLCLWCEVIVHALILIQKMRP